MESFFFIFPSENLKIQSFFSFVLRSTIYIFKLQFVLFLFFIFRLNTFTLALLCSLFSNYSFHNNLMSVIFLYTQNNKAQKLDIYFSLHIIFTYISDMNIQDLLLDSYFLFPNFFPLFTIITRTVVERLVEKSSKNPITSAS